MEVKPHGEILALLAGLVGAGKSVRLLNVYKGLPVTYEASVLDVHENVATFGVHRYQATCLELQRRAYIQSERLPGVARSSVLAVDMLEETAALCAFAWTSDSIGKRRAVRVHPKHLTAVELTIDDRTVRGQLFDLTFSALGVRTAAIFQGEESFPRRAPVSLQFRLPNAAAPLRLNGRVVSIRMGPEACQLGIALRLDPASKLALLGYMARRQAEILRELRMLYEIFCRLQLEAERGSS